MIPRGNLRAVSHEKKEVAMFTAFLIKYAEIGIKGKNRFLFEDALIQQIKYALKKCEGEFRCIKPRAVFLWKLRRNLILTK